MAENLDVLNTTVSLLIRAVLLAARFSGRVRQRSLKRLAAMDTDAKAREILLLKDRVYQLEMQSSADQEFLGIRRTDEKKRYTFGVQGTVDRVSHEESTMGMCISNLPA